MAVTAERRRGPGRPRGGGWSAEEARASLTSAAERCLADHGLDGLTMARVADEAGVSPATVYRHVANRDEILELVLEASTGRVTASAEVTAASAVSLTELMVEGMVTILGFVDQDPLLAVMFRGDERVVAGSVVAGSDPVFAVAVQFGHQIVGSRPDLAAELRVGLSVEETVDHLMRIGLGLLLTDARLVADADRLRGYLTAMVVPALVEVRPPLPERPPERTTRR